MNVTIKESPTHAPNPGQPRRRVVGFLFLDTTPAARLAPAGDVTPRTPQSSAEMKEAANLICAYLKRSLSSVEKLQFIELIKHSNAELFSTLFFPFRTNRKELYSLVEANGVDQIIKHIPIDELSKFINCLAGPGGLRIKQSADSLVVVLQCLYRRVERHPQRANTIAPIFRRLIDDARTYHETKNTFDKMIGHPEVLRRIRREEVAFDLLIQVNSANIPVL